MLKVTQRVSGTQRLDPGFLISLPWIPPLLRNFLEDPEASPAPHPGCPDTPMLFIPSCSLGSADG